MAVVRSALRLAAALIGILILLAYLPDILEVMKRDGNQLHKSSAIAAQEPQQISVKDALLDAKSLASRRAYVRISGVYYGLSDSLEMLYPPNHNPLSSEDSIRLLTEDASRAVREFFYNCRQQAQARPLTNVCPVLVTGHFGDCYLKINSAVTFTCLSVEEVEPLTSRSPTPAPAGVGDVPGSGSVVRRSLSTVTCDSVEMRAQATSVLNSRVASRRGPRAISIEEAAEVSRTAEEVRCKGYGTFSDDVTRFVEYRFYLSSQSVRAEATAK